jgi:hypothetical protein
MATKRVVKEAAIPVIDNLPEVDSTSQVDTEDPSLFNVNHDPDNQVVSFELTDGTSVVMKSPKAKQFLLLESFAKQADQEYLTDSFIMLKLASVCITKYGNQSSITFNDLMDNLELEDIERVVSALSFFRDKLDYLARKSAKATAV